MTGLLSLYCASARLLSSGQPSNPKKKWAVATATASPIESDTIKLLLIIRPVFRISSAIACSAYPDSQPLQKLRRLLAAYQCKYIIIRKPSFLFFCPHIHQYNLCFFYLLNLSSEEDSYLTRVDAIVYVHFFTEFQTPLEVAAYPQGYLVRPVECKRIPFSLEASKINCRLDR